MFARFFNPGSFPAGIHRQYCVQSVSQSVKVALSRAEVPQPEVLKHFEAEPEVVNNFPPSLLRRKPKSDSLYFTNAECAQTVLKHLRHTRPDVPIVELNPGIGVLTKELLTKTTANTIHCLEGGQKLFKSQMESLFLENVNRLTYSEGDLLRIGMRDSMDNGSRTTKYLPTVKQVWEDDPYMKIVGGVGSNEFFNNLINSLVFQTKLFSYGRCEFLLAVPPSLLLRYICNASAGYFSYRPRAVLFQILFDYEILEKMPRKDFLPWVHALKKNSKLAKLNEIHSDYLYLVRIVPRRELLSLCPAEHICTLSFFVRQVMSSGKHRIIPYLEKWIDNCGIRLILGSSGHRSSMPDQPPVVNGERLPDIINCSSATTLGEGKYLPNVNIFTEFGEISPQHIFYLFREFISWPEYGDSSFISLMQQHYMKMTERKDDEDVENNGRRRRA